MRLTQDDVIATRYRAAMPAYREGGRLAAGLGAAS
jgi:hypothetical protein